MELHQLEYFVAVAEEASFTRAATRVHVAQPGVSAQVRRLESELGQQLLDRSGRSVRLTEVGTAVLPFARAALSAVANVRLAVAELAGLVRGQVTVGMVSGCALPVLAELLAGFHDLYPGVSIGLTGGNPGRRVELLRESQLDLALIGSAGDPVSDVETAVIVAEELVAAVHPGHWPPVAWASPSSRPQPQRPRRPRPSCRSPARRYGPAWSSRGTPRRPRTPPPPAPPPTPRPARPPVAAPPPEDAPPPGAGGEPRPPRNPPPPPPAETPK